MPPGTEGTRFSNWLLSTQLGQTTSSEPVTRPNLDLEDLESAKRPVATSLNRRRTATRHPLLVGTSAPHSWLQKIRTEICTIAVRSYSTRFSPLWANGSGNCF